MNLSDYLTKHDGKPRSNGPELIRLAATAGLSAYAVYQAALGLRTFSPESAIKLHRASRERALTPEGLLPGVKWQRDKRGRVTGYVKSLPARVA